MEQKQITSYKEIFGMSKKKLRKGCAKFARYLLNRKREEYYLDQKSEEIMEIADLSNEEVKKRANKTIERRKDFPF